MEDEVQLAHVAEISVEHLDKQVDELQNPELIVVHVHAEDEEHPRITPVDDLVLSVL
eukprot:CAMPEP_0113821030 /NCGR_PEP_ID=MMETSP0328-20130328/1534_1 /TAXON_ID=39455 /ORGANISM="Alexandrium minutum" /LENGTH=56 /DNA_ID=CAMNT_0000788961 /DNA_START=165 /DNA_END=335 /DNA_ORIENTATION=+ /assembly_acc=CAM_ASM_000350